MYSIFFLCPWNILRAFFVYTTSYFTMSSITPKVKDKVLDFSEPNIDVILPYSYSFNKDYFWVEEA